MGLTRLLESKWTLPDPDGVIAQVQFFANTNLIGVSTNPSYSIIWNTDLGLTHRVFYEGGYLTARAVDGLGASTTSAPVYVGVAYDPPPWPVVEIRSPADGAILLLPPHSISLPNCWRA